MTDRPIIFSGPMVRALLDGHKTMTRRLAWLPPRDPTTGRIKDSYQRPTVWQHIEPGDRLWVRENFQLDRAKDDLPPSSAKDGSFIRYVADNTLYDRPYGKMRPSIHMPRWVSRLTLIVTDTAIEPLKSITSIDASREGVRHADGVPAGHQQFYIPIGDGEVLSGWTRKEVFTLLWERLHGPGSWHANPEVVAITFRVVKANIDALEEQAA